MLNNPKRVLMIRLFGFALIVGAVGSFIRGGNILLSVIGGLFSIFIMFDIADKTDAGYKEVMKDETK